MRWPLVRVGGRRAGRSTEGQRWFDRHVEEMRAKAKSSIAAFTDNDATVFVAADFSPCGCGAMVWTRSQDGIVTVTKSETFTCTEHERSPK